MIFTIIAGLFSGIGIVTVWLTTLFAGSTCT